MPKESNEKAMERARSAEFPMIYRNATRGHMANRGKPTVASVVVGTQYLGAYSGGLVAVEYEADALSESGFSFKTFLCF